MVTVIGETKLKSRLKICFEIDHSRHEVKGKIRKTWRVFMRVIASSIELEITT